jgi:hypothetical protein
VLGTLVQSAFWIPGGSKPKRPLLVRRAVVLGGPHSTAESLVAALAAEGVAMRC